MHYIGAILPQSVTVADMYTIADLRKADTLKKINPISTFYIPPINAPPTDDAMAELFGPGTQTRLLPRASKWVDPGFTGANAYGPHERAVIAQIDSHVVPKTHRSAQVSSAMKDFMIDLATKPKLLREYRANPEAVVDRADQLSSLEKFGLKLNKEGAVHALMTSTSADLKSGRVLTEEDIVAAGPPTQSFINMVVIATVIIAL